MVFQNKFLFLLLGIIFFLGFVSAVSVPDPFLDYDHDGILNINDNCYYVYNPFQLDEDLDGFGNCCDANYFGFPGYCDSLVQPIICGNGICEIGEDNLNCLLDCPIILPPTIICGNGILEVGEQCDDGLNNGIKCDYSDTDCNYCNSICQLITLHYSDEDESHDCSDDSKFLNFGCEPNWKCGGWSKCNAGIQTRDCKDTNNCVFAYNRPIEELWCEDEVLEKVFVKENNFLFFVLLGLAGMFLLLLLILLVKKK